MSNCSLHEVRYRPGLAQPPHHHSESSITIILAGSLTERVGRREEEARPLGVVVKPAGVQHSDRFGSHGAVTLQIVLDPPSSRNLDEHGSFGPWRWVHGGDPARRMLSVLSEWRRFPHLSQLAGRAVFDTLAALEIPEGRLSAPPPWLRRVADSIDDQWADPPSVTCLAREAGVHPVTLARIFRRCFGTSMTERIRRRRVQQAATLLAAGSDSLATVALRSGFSDQSHLCRIFRRETGLTPGNYRSLGRSA